MRNAISIAVFLVVYLGACVAMTATLGLGGSLSIQLAIAGWWLLMHEAIDA